MAQDNDAMPSLKRSPSSQASGCDPSIIKRQKRHYHHHHKLHQPIQTAQLLREQPAPAPAPLDDGAVTHLLNCSIGRILTSTGYDIAEPTALDAFRQATEEHILHLANFTRQAMTASRRTQPIPQDFEFALQRSLIGTDDLLPHIKPIKSEEEKTIPTLLPSPPPEGDKKDLLDAFDGLMPELSKDLSGEDERKRMSYIPAHFPHFPSKHTYRFTPVYTERDTDPRRIRELGMEDSRNGEEALRKLARAAFKDTHATGLGKSEKRLWGRKQESAESMFEKTVRGLSKKSQSQNQKPANATGDSSLPADSQGGGGTGAQKDNKFSLANYDLAPIVNCEREFWRKSTTTTATNSTTTPTGAQKAEKFPDSKDSAIAKVERWVST